MEVIIDSCKRTVACYESDDESGYKSAYSKYVESDDDDNGDDEIDENEDKDKNIESQDVKT